MKFDPLAGGDGWVLTTGGVDPITRQVQGNTTYFAVTSGWTDISQWT